MRKHGSIVAFTALLLTAPVLAAEPPSAKELLEKYGANLDKQTSFIVKWESSGVGARNVKGNSAGESSCEGEACYDGCRTAKRTYTWGKFGNDWIEPSRRVYHSLLWDGTAYYQYSRSTASPGTGGEPDEGTLTLVKTRSLDEIAKWLKSGGKVTDLKPSPSLKDSSFYRPYALGVGTEFGYFTDDEQRLDRVLLDESKILSVRPKTAKVNGVDCYVIDADTRRGKYTVWVDPKHGYQTARVVVARRGGDEALTTPGYKLPLDDSSIDVTVDYLRFRNVDGAWVAVETKHRYNRIFGVTHQFYRYHSRVRITSVRLNPDHEALRSFVPYDVRDGARVHAPDWWGKEGAGHLVWRNGKEVPDLEACRRYDERHGPKAAKRSSTAATRPSARAAQTETRPAAGKRNTGKVTDEGQTVYEEGSSFDPLNAHGE